MYVRNTGPSETLQILHDNPGVVIASQGNSGGMGILQTTHKDNMRVHGTQKRLGKVYTLCPTLIAMKSY
ncbi:hypothetical protein XYCOK13_29110 [Xylanibacillus composti]|uniref:Uncharacterized protein n=1 Tax=Xylanibacillus composti TaxID=1572762 RepID=A0A8J4M3I7_9BACL|nr:hypothetical protein XYCOK13_29110 [Xylanibacillus composti]